MTRTILLVDDSEHDQLSYQRALRDGGYAFRTAPTLGSGFALIAECRPDVVLLDYKLPDGDGLGFIRQLNGQGSDEAPPVVMLTGSGDEAVAVSAMKAGASDYLIKDVGGRHLKLLPAVVERALRERDDRLARREAERQLQLAANVYLNILEGVVATDPDGIIVSVNPAFCAMTGYAEDQLLGNNPRLIKSNRHEPAFYQDMWGRVGQEGVWRGEVWNRRQDGSLFLSRETITAIRDNQGRLQNYVAVLTDITEAKQAEESIRRQAYHDPLTQLPNRSLFMDRLRHQIAYAHRQKTGLAVFFIDLDGFKAVNDKLGHEVGDDVLKEAAARLAGCVRESDTVARLGGDEFTAIIEDVDGPVAAALVAQKMLDQLARPFRIGRHEPCVSASIGIARYPADSIDAVGLVKMADEAMYQAKRSGKNAYRMNA